MWQSSVGPLWPDNCGSHTTFTPFELIELLSRQIDPSLRVRGGTFLMLQRTGRSVAELQLGPCGLITVVPTRLAKVALVAGTLYGEPNITP